MENAPDDVLYELFIRLPAKLVARMRGVCKSWNEFLTRPFFIKSHLDHSKITNKEILLEFNAGFNFDAEYPCTAHYSRSPNREIRNFLVFPVNRPRLGFCSLIGSVNGLICFISEGITRSTPGVHIWNPSLSAFLTLPSYSIHTVCKVGHLRFGFDPKADDYKVVKILKYEELNNIKEWQVEVYSMRKGSWEVITERFPSQVRTLCTDEFSVGWHDGHVHWLGYNDMTKDLTIVAFDLYEKTFCVIPVPHCQKDDRRERRWLNYLAMWNGKLCLISLLGHDKYEMWMMNEYKVAESWVKCNTFNILLLSRMKSPFRFTVNKEYLLQAYRNRLSLYDPVAKSFKYMVRLKPSDTKIVPHVDSLVWVAPSKSESPAATTADSELKRKINVIDGESKKKAR